MSDHLTLLELHKDLIEILQCMFYCKYRQSMNFYVITQVHISVRCIQRKKIHVKNKSFQRKPPQVAVSLFPLSPPQEVVKQNLPRSTGGSLPVPVMYAVAHTKRALRRPIKPYVSVQLSWGFS